jgi:hypothetical protein
MLFTPGGKSRFDLVFFRVALPCIFVVTNGCPYGAGVWYLAEDMVPPVLVAKVPGR